MSSGEADGGLFSLDTWRKCEIEGCPWHVLGRRCRDHGGQQFGPEWRSDEWGHVEYRLSEGDLVLRGPIR